MRVAIRGYQLCVDAQELSELEAAIAAHCERLKADGVELRVPIEQLHPMHLMDLPDTGPRPEIARALVINLRTFAALRDLAKIQQHRVEAREAAQRAVRNAAPENRADAERRAKQVELLMDGSSFEQVAPSLTELDSRQRTLGRKLDEFHGHLDHRRRRAGELELPGLAAGATLDMALTRWMFMRCVSLEADIEFFRSEIQGPVAIPPAGHAGPADNKAWHRVKGAAVLALKEAGVTASERRALFPGTHLEPLDAVSKRRKKESQRQAAKRAKSRRTSTG